MGENEAVLTRDAGRVELVGPEERHIGLRRLRGGDHALEQIGLEEVVGVEEEQVRALGGVKTCVAGGTRTLRPRVRDDAHAPVAGGIGGKHLGHGIRGAVVHRDELEVAHRLRQHPVERRRKPLGPVVHGHDDGDKRGALRHGLDAFLPATTGQAAPHGLHMHGPCGIPPPADDPAPATRRTCVP